MSCELIWVAAAGKRWGVLKSNQFQGIMPWQGGLGTGCSRSHQHWSTLGPASRNLGLSYQKAYVLSFVGYLFQVLLEWRIYPAGSYLASLLFDLEIDVGSGGHASLQDTFSFRMRKILHHWRAHLSWAGRLFPQCEWDLVAVWDCPICLSVAVIQERRGRKGFIWLTWPDHSPSLTEIRAGTQR